MGSITTNEVSFDPALASLFASSSGPVKVHREVAATARSGKHSRAHGDDVATSSILEQQTTASSSDDSGTDSEDQPSTDSSTEEDNLDARPRKRLRFNSDDLEATYFKKLADEEERELKANPKIGHPSKSDQADPRQPHASTGSDNAEVEDDVPLHESLLPATSSPDDGKESRTIFLSNVSTQAIRSRSSRRELLAHLQSALSSQNGQPSDKIESIRFRSTAYVSSKGPKKATYAKQELMDQTTKSTNAYVIFTSEAAARKVARTLNGSIVLDRHLRIDLESEPSRRDHRRCVYVGNLPFVDEEVKDDQKAEKGNERRAKSKTPADVEEGLWRTFSKAGKVENVRVVRDKETRVGKGFAYVQFADENAVEAALLLNEKKFPPMLPRTLRVTRAKRITEKGGQGVRNRTNIRPGQSPRSTVNGPRTGGQKALGVRATDGGPAAKSKLIFEGYRASTNSKMSLNHKKRKAKPTGRSAKRGAAFKASGGKKKRDSR